MSAALDKKYTVEFHGDDTYYEQLLGGNASAFPDELKPGQFTTFTVTADSGPQRFVYALKKFRPTPDFAPTLTAREYSPGHWARVTGMPSDWEYGCQWYLDGLAMHKAWSDGYWIRAADGGGKLSVAVTAYNPGFRPKTVVTEAVRLGKVTPKVLAKLPRASIDASAVGKVEVTVKIDRVDSPEGKIRVRAGGETTTVKLKEFDRGTVLIKLPALAKGTHKITATYLGTAYAKKVTATPVTLTVR
jgi:hypothetical protein